MFTLHLKRNFYPLVVNALQALGTKGKKRLFPFKTKKLFLFIPKIDDGEICNFEFSKVVLIKSKIK